MQTKEQTAHVLCSFKKESDQDITVYEGDKVTVIAQLDDNWLMVRNDAGITGMCPLSCVDIINAHKLREVSENTYINGNVINIGGSCAKSNSEMVLDKIEIVKRITSGVHSADVGHDVSLTNDKTNGENLQSDNIMVNPKLDSNAIITPQPESSVLATQSDSKPQLPPKPALRSASKPQLPTKPVIKSTSEAQRQSKPVPKPKPKPASRSQSKLSPNSLLSNDADESHVANLSTFARSSKALSFCASNANDAEAEQMGSLSKCHSAYEINNYDPDLFSQRTNLSERKESNSGIGSPLCKPLDSNVQCELANGSNTNLVINTSSYVSHEQCFEVALKYRNTSLIPNNSRENVDTGAQFGNSMFYDFEEPAQPTVAQLKNQAPLPENKKFELFRLPNLQRPSSAVPTSLKTPVVLARALSQTLPTCLNPAQPFECNRDPHKHEKPVSKTPTSMPLRLPGSDSIGCSLIGSDTCITENKLASEPVLALKARIANLKKDLEDLKKSKSELEHQAQDKVKDTEIHDQIQLLQDNITGKSEELNILKRQLSDLCLEEKTKMEQEILLEQQMLESRLKELENMEKRKAERKVMRMRVIDELIQTEKDYLKSLNLVIETFLVSTAEKHPDVSVELLFGNIEEVAEVSQKLLATLEDATCGKDFTEQIIGICFVNLAEDMKNVYAPYCRNHDEVITLIKKYSQNADIKSFLDKLLYSMRDRHVVFDLEALLIKPVQRILKYPLLLKELLKTTDDDHEDRVVVNDAIRAMTDVAIVINEYKRRKDLVFKYKRDTDTTLDDKLAKLNLHSIRKKSSRIKERIYVNLGLTDQTCDPDFDRVETRYRQLEKAVRVFVKNVQLDLEELKKLVNDQECIAADIAGFFGENDALPELVKYQIFAKKILVTFLPNCQVEIEELVINPLSQLLQSFEGPNNVIEKRYDKLLDYDNWKRNDQSEKENERPMQIAKQDYEALNAQLLDELPKMYTLASQLFMDCIGSFVRAHREFTNNIMKDMYSFLDFQNLTEGIIESFNIKHTSIVDKLARLHFMPMTFCPRIADQRQDKRLKRNQNIEQSTSTIEGGDLETWYCQTAADPPLQTQNQKIFVMQQYGPQKLFQVTKTTVAMDVIDISLGEGDIVGVLKDRDPMGNKERWFVDNGASKGFVWKTILTPYNIMPAGPCLDGSQPHSESSGNKSPVLNKRLHCLESLTTVSSSVSADDEMDFALDEDMSPDIPDTILYDMDTTPASGGADQLYFAAYPFHARNSNEVTLYEQQVVTVVAKHDQNGNPDWWYVKAHGVFGYVPATYLCKMDTHTHST